MLEPGQRLSGRQVLAILGFAVLFGAPAIVCVERRIGPGDWIVGVQDRLLGSHLPVVSMALIMVLEILAVGLLVLCFALVVRRLTGRTVVELIARSRRPQ